MSTFFDLMPNDIHSRIAHYLFSSARHKVEHQCEAYLTNSIADDNLLDTLLNYAKVGPVQCRSVLRSFSNRLYITDDWRSQRAVDWVSIFANHLQTLEISDAPEFSFPGSPPLLPKLERAVITIRQDQMSLIQGSPELKDLTVFIFDTHGWEIFVSTVCSLRLEELKLHFMKDYVLENLSRIELMSLRTACRDVEFLYMDADTSLSLAAWDMVKGMPSLKKLTVSAPIEDENLPFVQNLQEIGLLYIFDIAEATEVGPTVTHLEFFLAYDVEILRLELLPNLRTLTIRPLNGHERALVGMISSVEELKLSWDHSACSHTFESTNGLMTGWHPVYHEPDGKVLEKILRSAKSLHSLQIKKAILSSDVIISLFKIAGGKLEKLEICHDWQKEPVPTRMERILKGVARYCPNLKTLSFLESVYHYGQSLPIFATEEQTIRCSMALEEVAAAVPGFMSYRHVRSTILYRFTEERSEIMTWHDMLQGPCVVAEQ